MDARVVAVVADREGVHLADRRTGEVATVQPPGDWRLWAEYESASMGRAQLVWSRNRKQSEDDRSRLWALVLASRGNTTDRTDAELADERLNGEEVVTISRDGWRAMLSSPKWLCELLDVVECKPESVQDWLLERGVQMMKSYSACNPRAA